MKEFELNDYMRMSSRLILIHENGEFIFLDIKNNPSVENDLVKAYNYYTKPKYFSKYQGVPLVKMDYKTTFFISRKWLIEGKFYYDDKILILGEFQ